MHVLTLKNDAKKVIGELLGEMVAKQLDSFEDPEKYPKDFLDECTFFLSRLTGEETAKAKFTPIYKKYKIKLAS
ncbi:MAG: hypothetical protein V1818_03005 [Candidatus Aenigmatarchaeota archaeon]